MAIHDIRIENYQDQYDIYYNGYVEFILRNRTELVADGSEDEADITRLMVDVEAFVALAYQKQILLPNEFLERIDKADKTIKLIESGVDKYAIQVIAKTLWAINPSWTQEQIAAHEGVKVHARGWLYALKSVKKWISEVDPRDPASKTGPRKQIASKQYEYQ